MDAATVRLAPFGLKVHLGPVLAIMAAACGLDESTARRREQIVRRHAARPGLVATGAFAAEDLVGYCYGFPADPDGVWERRVRSVMAAAGALDWLGGAFQVAELHVHPDHQGRGLGHRLLASVLSATDLPRAVLNARAGESAARRLYREFGFADLTPPFRFDAGPARYTVMGTPLAHS